MARATKAQRRAEKQRADEERRKRETSRRTIRVTAITIGAGLALVAMLVLLWPEPQEGDTSAEAWDLPQLDGDGRMALSDFRGTPTVAAFFASWCDVCEQEIPEYLALSKQVGDAVLFVGIDTQDNGRGLGDAEKRGIAGVWPLAEDIGNGNGSGLSTGSFGIRGSPMTVFYDENGAVLHVQRGGLSGEQLLSALNEFYGV